MVKKQPISQIIMGTILTLVLTILVTLQMPIMTYAIENVKTSVVIRNVATETELMAAIADATVEVIHLQGQITVSRSLDGKDNAFVIGRAVTITGEGTSGGLYLERAGIILGGEVTFENMSIYFANPVRNAIIANGYTLTLNNISNGGSSYNIDIFGGGITDYNGGNAEEIPVSGSNANVIIKGTNTLTGVNAKLNGGNIYAGSLSDVGNGVPDSPNVYEGNVNITIEKDASGFGKIYAHGARENREGGYPDAWKSDASSYKVTGDVNVTLNTCKSLTLDGATGGAQNATFTYMDDGNGYPCHAKLENISEIALVSSDQVTYLEPEITGECSLQSVTVPANTRLSFTGVADGNISVASYSGGGELVLSKTQALKVTKQISGFTKLAVGGVDADGMNSTDGIEEGTTYVTVAVLEAENYGFELLPHQSNYNMVLEDDGNGNWVTAIGESSVIINEISEIEDVVVPELDDYGLPPQISIPCNVTYTTENESNFMGNIPMLVTVNGKASATELGYMGYQYVTGVSDDDILIWFDYSGDNECIYIENEAGYEYAVPAGRYEISMTIPERYMSNAVAKTISFVLTVTCTEHRGGTATSDSQAICEVCGTAYGELKPKPPVHVHNWSYTADNGVITAVCMADNCDMSEENVEMRIVVPAESDLIYDGTSKNVVVQASVDGILEIPTVSYTTQSGETLEGAPVNAGNYYAYITVGEGDVSQTAYVEFTIRKRDTPPNMPGNTIQVGYSHETIESVELPEGWVWSEEDRNKTLEVGVPIEVTATYVGANKGNYVTESVTVKIMRQGCPHTGETMVKDVREATCEVAGYTGDIYCADCGELIATGTVTEKLQVHVWDNGVITKEPTSAQNGEKTYTCNICKTTMTESLPALGAPEVGKEEASDDGKAVYEITTSDLVKGTVKYLAPTDIKKDTVTIPSTVVIDGVTYKVTAVEKNAFKSNKYIKSVTIGKNVKSIGANAFYNCTKLTTVKFGSNVTNIGDKAFYKCTSLTAVNLPSEVKTIGKQTFYGCKKVTSVTLGKKVTSIGSKAFYDCSKLKTLTIKSTKLTAKKLGSKAFGKTSKSITVKLPKKKSAVYMSMLIKSGVNKKAKFKKI